MAKVGGLLDEKDPRLSSDDGIIDRINDGRIIAPQHRKLFDTSVTIEEYFYYADLTREDQAASAKIASANKVPLLKVIFPPKSNKVDLNDRMTELNTNKESNRMTVTDSEWVNASKALRNATAMAIFYLMTTDVLGPFGLPYAVASTGWGPSVALYTIFGVMAAISGTLLWLCFMGLDSYQFPCRTYSDLAFRIFGPVARYIVLAFQALQLLMSVSIILISNGEALSQASKFRLCYAICVLVWAIAGFIFGQIRTLQKFGFLANFAIWLNLLIMFITMGVAAHSPPLYSAYAASAGYAINPNLVKPNAAGVYPPVQQSGGLPDQANFGASINGLMNAVYAYSGAQIFIDFMAEMSNPRDFLKSMWGSQLFIYLCYMLYGLFMYGYQGQYVQNPSYLGISPYAWSTTGNVLAMITALIAAALYGNIGLKVIYNSIGVQIFHAPPLYTKRGKWIWASIVPVYWSIAYAIGGAIPAFSGFVGLVSAVCGMQFTYSFPPLLYMGYITQKQALLPGEGFDPATGQVTGRGSSAGKGEGKVKRLVRGFLGGRWYVQIACLLYMLGALATAGLGIWAAVENMIAIYKVPQLNAFVCKSPLDATA